MFKLILISSAGIVKAAERLVEKNPFVIGKEEGIDWTLPDKSTSRRHLQFEKRGDGWWLRDLNSTNGTFVNGEPFSEKLLAHNDIVQIGETSFFVNLSAADISDHIVQTISKKIPFINTQSIQNKALEEAQQKSPVKLIQKNIHTKKAPDHRKPIPASPSRASSQRARSTANKSTTRTPPPGADFSQFCFMCGCMGFIAFLPAILLGHLDRPSTLERQKLRDRGLVLGYLFLLLWIAGGVYYWKTRPDFRKPKTTITQTTPSKKKGALCYGPPLS